MGPDRLNRKIDKRFIGWVLNYKILPTIDESYADLNTSCKANSVTCI